jgi:PII-like signaling protein
MAQSYQSPDKENRSTTAWTRPMLMRVYTDEDALHGDERVADLVVRRAWEARLAGATALRGRAGFGGSRIHAHHLFGIDDNPPVVVEIVDDEARLRAFAADLADLHSIALVTLERVEILRGAPAATPAVPLEAPLPRSN